MLPSRLVAQVMKNVPPARPASTELVSTLAVLTILVESVLSAQLTTTGPTVNVHLDLQEIHTVNVFLVRIINHRLANSKQSKLNNFLCSSKR